MQKQISPVAMLVAIVLVVALIGFFGYRAITPQVDDPRAPSPEDMKARMMGGGSSSGSGARPGGAPGGGGTPYMNRSGPPSGFGGR